MPRAEFRFYAELNDFLPPERQFTAVEYDFLVSPSVKDAIESFGVPHTEVDLITARGEPVGFDYLLREGDRVAVYPMFEAFDIRPVVRLRPEPLRETKFVLDVHLGRLAAYLRMLGFDAAYGNSSDDPELVAVSLAEHRIVLTRDRGLLKRSALTHGSYVRSTNPREQLAEVVQRFDLAASIRPFSRCLRCNVALEPVQSVEGRVPEGIARRHREFHECPRCRRVYWKGTHFQRMNGWIAALLPS